jgi:predicted nucleic acid-binding protein
VILVDTSAWVEFLQATGSATHQRVRELLTADAPLATTEVVLMELLTGARTAQDATDVRRLLLRGELLTVQTPTDWETAGDLFGRCRRQGQIVRTLSDCLIAAVAIRHDVPVLHRDRDFDVLVRHTSLQSVAPA